MKQLLSEKVWPVTAGLFVAFVVMMVCEYINSHFYPLPTDLDWKDPDAVAAFTATLPWSAYILVFMGWIVGSALGGYITARISQSTNGPTLRLVLITGGILSLMGLLNNAMLGHSVVFQILTVPLFAVLAYAGYRYRTREKGTPTQTTPSTPLIPRV